MLLTTFRQGGTPVGAIVWVAPDDGRLLVWTESGSWNVRRIKRKPHVNVAACDSGGTPTSAAADAIAEVLDRAGTARVRSAISRKYGLWSRAAS